MFLLQRIVALLMACAFVGFFLIPMALKRHDVNIVVLVAAVLVIYLAFNAWLLTRRRAPRS